MNITDEEAIINNFFKMYNDKRFIIKRKIKPRNIVILTALSCKEKYEELCFVGLRKRIKKRTLTTEVADAGEVENINKY
jgi:hypothetical protein